MSAVLVLDDGSGVRELRLNRPERRNAIDMPLREELAGHLEIAMAEDDVRSILLTGAGPTFCSGGDIATMRRVSEEEARPRAEAAQRVTRAIWEGPKPVVAAVQGDAYGAGLSLALACDLAIVADVARVSTAFMRVGLAGDMGITVSLPARVGVQRARQLMLQPRSLSGIEAFEAGLFDDCAAAAEVHDRAREVATALAASAPLAVAATKRLLAGTSGISAALAHEVDEQVRLFASHDFAEGVAAFLDRREPRFEGR